jgi:hypothetical protein
MALDWQYPEHFEPEYLGLDPASGLVIDRAGVARPVVAVQRAFVLSEKLARKLAAHCALTGDEAAEVVADGIVLLIDQDDFAAEDFCVTGGGR